MATDTHRNHASHNVGYYTLFCSSESVWSDFKSLLIAIHLYSLFTRKEPYIKMNVSEFL